MIASPTHTNKISKLKPSRPPSTPILSLHNSDDFRSFRLHTRCRCSYVVLSEKMDLSQLQSVDLNSFPSYGCNPPIRGVATNKLKILASQRLSKSDRLLKILSHASKENKVNFNHRNHLQTPILCLIIIIDEVRGTCDDCPSAMLRKPVRVCGFDQRLRPFEFVVSWV